MSDLLVEVDEHGVLLATLNRPERMNALGGTMAADLLEVLRRPAGDPSIRAVVLTGAGRAFCAGAEITPEADPTKPRTDVPPPPARRRDALGASGRTAIAFRDCAVPVIGAINGVAVGGGFGIALGCDVRIAAESARLGSIFIKRGLATDYGAAYWLPRIVGTARAFEILYDGDPLEAARALELGLVNRVVPDDRLMDEALAFARRIAAGPPLAYPEVRRLVHASLDTGSEAFFEREWTVQAGLLRTADAREGFASFSERRPPRFRGV